MRYRDNDYFNDTQWFTFMRNDGSMFKSKCHNHRGYWFTNESLNYKCTSLKAKLDIWEFSKKRED